MQGLEPKNVFVTSQKIQPKQRRGDVGKLEQVKKDDIERKAQGMIIVTASTAWLGVCFGTATVVVAMALATEQMRSIFYVVVFVFMLHVLNAQRRDVSTNDLAKPKRTKLGPHTYCSPRQF